jgi:hypothetical protein
MKINNEKGGQKNKALNPEGNLLPGRLQGIFHQGSNGHWPNPSWNRSYE